MFQCSFHTMWIYCMYFYLDVSILPYIFPYMSYVQEFVSYCSRMLMFVHLTFPQLDPSPPLLASATLRQLVQGGSRWRSTQGLNCLLLGHCILPWPSAKMRRMWRADNIHEHAREETHMEPTDLWKAMAMFVYNPTVFFQGLHVGLGTRVLLRTKRAHGTCI